MDRRPRRDRTGIPASALLLRRRSWNSGSANNPDANGGRIRTTESEIIGVAVRVYPPELDRFGGREWPMDGPRTDPRICDSGKQHAADSSYVRPTGPGPASTSSVIQRTA